LGFSVLGISRFATVLLWDNWGLSNFLMVALESNYSEFKKVILDYFWFSKWVLHDYSIIFFNDSKELLVQSLVSFN
jgi:hypothetical protein